MSARSCTLPELELAGPIELAALEAFAARSGFVVLEAFAVIEELIEDSLLDSLYNLPSDLHTVDLMDKYIEELEKLEY
jgi:hypothetical protein